MAIVPTYFTSKGTVTSDQCVTGGLLAAPVKYSQGCGILCPSGGARFCGGDCPPRGCRLPVDSRVRRRCHSHAGQGRLSFVQISSYLYFVHGFRQVFMNWMMGLALALASPSRDAHGA